MTTSTRIIKFILIAAVALFVTMLVLTAIYTSKHADDNGYKVSQVDKFKVNPEIRRMMFVNMPTYAAMKMLEHKIDRWQGATSLAVKDKGWAIFAFLMNILFAVWWIYYNPAKEDAFKDVLDKGLPVLAFIQTVGILFILFSDISIFIAKYK